MPPNPDDGNGVLGCGGTLPTTFPCPDTHICTPSLDPCLRDNCACYFNWENKNSRGEWNIIYPTDPEYSQYCSPMADTGSCFKWGFDTKFKTSYELPDYLQTCGGGGSGIPQKGFQRLRYAPSTYISQNAGEEGDSFYFPFPIYNSDGITPLTRSDGSPYTTDNNGEVSGCDCGRLILFQDTDGFYKIKIDPAKGRILQGTPSEEINFVSYFAIPNKYGTKGSDLHEHGFCIINGLKDCDYDSESNYCHGEGRRNEVSEGQATLGESRKPVCLGEFGIKEFVGNIYFVDSAGVATHQRTITELDQYFTTAGPNKVLPPYSRSQINLFLILRNTIGAIEFYNYPDPTGVYTPTLKYNPDTMTFSEILDNSIAFSKFYKTQCCGGSSVRLANIVLSRDLTTFEGDTVLPGFESCRLPKPTWWDATASLLTLNDSYKSVSNQYNGLERKQQSAVERWANRATVPYVYGPFYCDEYCGNCPLLEANIFNLIRGKLCGSTSAKIVGNGGIFLSEESVAPKYHVPDIRLSGNLNNFNYYCTNLTIDSTTKFGSIAAVPTVGSTLHKDNIISSNDYIQGRCMNVETPVGTILPYQDSKSGDVCSDYILTTSNTNQFDKRCYWYWSQRFDNSSGDQTIPTALEYHWLSGGYFYGNKNLRNNIYQELGTIHFNTSVNINNFAYDITTANKTSKDYTIKIIADTATEYPDINNLWDIAQSHISVGFATSSIDPRGTTVNGAVPFIKYGSTLKNYSAEYSPRSITQYIDTLSLGTSFKFTAEMGTGNTVTEDVNDIFVKLISSTTGLTTQWPKTDKFFSLVIPTQLSFLVDAGSGDSYTKTYYNVVDSPTSIYVDPTSGGYTTTTLEYFANNAIESSMAFITDAVPITTYENYKFFGSIIGKNTISISSGTSNVIYDNLNTKVTTTATTKFDYLSDIITQMSSNPDAIGLLNLYNYTVSGTNIVLDTTTNILSNGGSINRIQKNGTGVFTQIVITLNEDIPLLPGKTYGNAYSLPFMIKLISSYSGTTTNLNNQNKEGILTQNTTNNNFSFNSPFPIKNFDVLATGVAENSSKEYPLFDLNSSKFSTPDYSFIKLSPVSDQSLGTEQIIPLRGAEYSVSEKQSYPTYRTIRKANGKYYLQILAGAFPYFHSVVHLPAIKGVSQNDNQDSAVEESLKKVCSKNIDWYNHVATTKWTCLIKHTQFSQNIPEWKALTNTKGVNQTYKPVILGRGPQVILSRPSRGRPIIESRNLDELRDVY